ncbi:hypothetical protein GmHk_03G006884 [Glycine max]|nr:hypothetical protein GmHk_03G006884 [Glycine max]
MKLAKYRLKAQVEKDEGPSGEGQSPRLEKDEGPSNPCGVYPDLSSFTGSGVYPDLSSFTGSGVYPGLSSFTGSGVVQKLYSLYQAIRPVRFTSSGIRASGLDTDLLYKSNLLSKSSPSCYPKSNLLL